MLPVEKVMVIPVFVVAVVSTTTSPVKVCLPVGVRVKLLSVEL